MVQRLRNYGILEVDPHEVVAGDTAKCSTMVSVRDISVMASALASGGDQVVLSTPGRSRQQRPPPGPG
ncbi:hypothetical protein D3I60_16355 [Brevibacterium permense]|nr:hypothetical protein [Brevibacterium permense]